SWPPLEVRAEARTMPAGHPPACGGDSNSVGEHLEACPYMPLPGDRLPLLFLDFDRRRVESPARGGPGQRHFLEEDGRDQGDHQDRKSTRLNSSHDQISYAVFCLKKKKNQHDKRY